MMDIAFFNFLTKVWPMFSISRAIKFDYDKMTVRKRNIITLWDVIPRIYYLRNTFSKEHNVTIDTAVLSGIPALQLCNKTRNTTIPTHIRTHAHLNHTQRSFIVLRRKISFISSCIQYLFPFSQFHVQIKRMLSNFVDDCFLWKSLFVFLGSILHQTALSH